MDIENFSLTKVQPSIAHVDANLTHRGEVISKNVVWYPNLGVTHHVTNDISNLPTSIPIEGPNLLEVGNGSKLPITHIGALTVHINNDHAKQENILVVPKIKKDLLSIYYFCNDNPLNIEFNDQGFYVMDQQTQAPILQWATRGELY
jgi:hypothetical protein